MLSSSRRPICLQCQLSKVYQPQQTRHATLIKRPKRPYTFTQLVTLSDGSTFLQRTTSPEPVYRSTKDTKNSILWNPSSQKLFNVEEDEAGRLKRFRSRFGRGWDAEVAAEEVEEEGTDVKNASKDKSASSEPKEERDSLLDLMTASANEAANTPSKSKKDKK